MNNKNNNTKAMFIKTQDQETCENLKVAGFQLVDFTNGTWTFVNNPECLLTFDKNKITYSNMLCF